MDLPDDVAEFVDEALSVDNPMLPQSYPDPDALARHWADAWASRGTPDDGWDPAWVVLGRNRFGDPFFIDCAEAGEGFPVYFAFADAPGWEPIEVVASLDGFASLLAELQELEADPLDALAWLRDRVDADGDLWAAVIESYRLAQSVFDRPAAVPAEGEAEYAFGWAVVLDLGDDAPSVIRELARLFRVSEAEVEQLALRGDITVKRDHLINLRPLLERLAELGAITEFRAAG